MMLLVTRFIQTYGSSIVYLNVYGILDLHQIEEKRTNFEDTW